jgi:hypothetical protein
VRNTNLYRPINDNNNNLYDDYDKHNDNTYDDDNIYYYMKDVLSIMVNYK